VTIRTRKGRLCQINTSRRAAYGYDQRFEVLGSGGMLAAGNHRPTEVSAHRSSGISVDTPEPFFLERYRTAYAEEMIHFAAVLRGEVALAPPSRRDPRARDRRGRYAVGKGGGAVTL